MKKTRKTLYSILLCAIICVCFVFGLTACKIKHEHTYGEWSIVTNATCTQEGEQKKSCSCGDTITETIAALGHTEEIDAAVAPDCTNTGLTEGKHCSVCNEKIVAQTVVDALGHAYGAPIYVWSADNSTCTATRVCDRDDAHTESETATVASVVTQNKSCTDDELTTYTATFTNSAFETQIMENVKTADKLGHTYGDLIARVEATCSATGFEAHYFCDVCDTYFTSEKVEATATALTIAIDENAHNYGAWNNEVSATCTAAGTKGYQYCSVCEKNYDVNDIEIPDLTIAIDENAHTTEETTLSANNDGTHDVVYTCCNRAKTENVSCVASNLDNSCLTEDICECGYVVASTQTAHNLSAKNGDVKTLACTNKNCIYEEIGYNVFVNGVQVREGNVTDVLGDGKVVFDADNKTLAIHGNIKTLSIAENCAIEVFGQIEAEAISITGGTVLLVGKESAKISYTKKTTSADKAADAPLYITNSTVELRDIVLEGNKLEHNWSPICLTDGANVTFNTGAVIQNFHKVITRGNVLGSKGVICLWDSVDSNVTLTMNDGASVINNVGASGGIIATSGNNGCKFIMNGGIIRENTVTESNMGSIWCWFGETKFLGGIVYGSSDETGMYAVLTQDKGIVTVYGGEFYGRESAFGFDVHITADSIKFNISEDNAIYIGDDADTVERLERVYTENGLPESKFVWIGHKHNYGAFVAEIPATCETSGEKGYYQCATCERNYDADGLFLANLTIPALGHDYETTYNWTDDHSACIATRVCNHDNAHIETENASIASSITQNRSCTDDELTTFTATFTSSVFETQIKENVKTADKLGHNYENEICLNCGDVYGSEGLSYTLNDDGTYAVSGIGTCTDADIIIPSKYQGVAITSIANWAFSGCSTITSVIMPDSVTRIGASSFEGCSALKEILIPNSVVSIKEYAFYGCSLLESVNIPNSVTSIENGVFQNCPVLASVTLGNNIESIGSYTFTNCSALTEIVIPDSVTVISQSMFARCSSLLNVQFGGDVKSIGNYAFYGCSLLESISLGNKVETIGEYAFQNCSALTSIVIPDSVTSIGDYAFVNCSLLENVTLGSSVETIGASAFEDCVALTSIIIPNSVTSIGNSAFRSCISLARVTLGSSVQTIGVNAFVNSVLTELIIPDSVTSIGDYAFVNCSLLENVTLGSSVETIGASAFEDCVALTSIIIPNSVTSIGNSAFRYCAVLSSITFEDNSQIASIDEGAFYVCGALEKIYFGGSMEEWNAIPKGANWNGQTGEYIVVCTDGTLDKSGNIMSYAETTYVWSDDISLCTATRVCITNEAYTETESVSVTSAITQAQSCTDDEITTYTASFMGSAFETQTKNITTADKLGHEEIAHETKEVSCFSKGWNAHVTCSRCDYSTCQEIPATGHNYVSGYCSVCGEHTPTEGLTYSLNSDKSSYSVSYSDSYTDTHIYVASIYEGLPVTAVGNLAFWGNSTVESITLPESITSIDSMAFYQCTALKSVSLPESLIVINDGAFSGCAALESIVIPDSVTTLGASVFEGCSALTSITLGDNFETIGEKAFYGCSALTSIVIPDSVTTLGASAFEGCSKLKSVTLSASLESIGEKAFYNCSALTSIVIPDSVTSIGTSAFYRCSVLTSVTLSASLESISNYAFAYCISLKSVTVPESVTSIGTSAFYRCSGLDNVTLPKTLTEIGDSAFNRCNDVTTVTYGDTLKQWETLTRGDNWINSDVEYILICTDTGMDINGNLLCSGSSYTADHTYANGNCSACGYLQTHGLAYTLNSDGSTYTVSGIGECPDTDIYIPSVYMGLPVTHIANRAFYDCASLTSVTLPDSVVSVGQWVFYRCKSLKSVTMSDNVSYIGEAAFYNCSALESINIPASLTYISTNVFYYCTSLTSIVLPDSLNSISFGAFHGCSRLTSVTFSSAVTYIGNMALYSCSKLTTITFKGTMEQWNAINKEINWNNNAGEYTVVCSDGTLDKDGNVVS